MMLWLTLICFSFSVAVNAAQASNNRAVVEIAGLSESDIGNILKFGEENHIDFLTQPSSEIPFYGLMKEENKEAVMEQIEKLFRTNTKEVTEEVTRALHEHSAENDKLRANANKFRSSAYSTFFNYYPSLTEIYAWLGNLTQTFPGVSLSRYGQSYEGRPLYVLKINSGRNLPIIFVESTIHCREWLSPATTIYMIAKILTGHNREVYSKYELQFSLVTNPDGYQFTHDYRTSTQGRFWRKNRRPFNNGRCYGVDLNRNFDVRFGGVGVSHDCSSDIYCGPSALSEPETQALSKYVTPLARSIKMYLAIHTFGQMIIVPYAYANTRPRDDTYFRYIANAAAATFRQVGGRTYFVGNTQELGLGLVSGSVVDWAIDRLNISSAFAFELLPRGVNAFSGGFNPPASAIVPSGEETFAAFTTMLSNLR